METSLYSSAGDEIQGMHITKHTDSNETKNMSKVVTRAKLQKDLNNNYPHLSYRQTPLKIKGNLMGSKTNSQQALVHWLREITKAELCQAKGLLF